MSDHVPPLPASDTKHLTTLHHPVPGSNTILPLKQLSANTGTTGTTLWLSAQLLALYFSSLPSKRGVVVDLGSGVGFLPLCLASKGWEVVASDTRHVIDSVLAENVRVGLEVLDRDVKKDKLGSGDVKVTELDWEEVSLIGRTPDILAGKKIEMITTSDTIYAPHLLDPLFRTLRILSSPSTTIYIGLERRDPALVDDALKRAGEMGLSLRRVDKDKVDRLMIDAKWDSTEWDGVEIWKGKFSRASLAAVSST